MLVQRLDGYRRKTLQIQGKVINININLINSNTRLGVKWAIGVQNRK